MGVIAYIYKHPMFAQCSNGGISSRVDGVTIMNADGPFEPTAERPAVIVEAHGVGVLRAVPAVKVGATWQKAPGWYQMGGAFVGCSGLSDLCDRLVTESRAASHEEAVDNISKSTRPDPKREQKVQFHRETANYLRVMPIRFYGAIALHDRTE